MTIPILATIVRALWVIVEYPYLRRHRIKPARATRDLDKHSAKLWDAANALELVGMVLGFTRIGRIHKGGYFIAALGLPLLCVGIIIRWAAIYALGKYFTGTVLIQDECSLLKRTLSMSDRLCII